MNAERGRPVEYSIGELAHYLGMSSQGLHWYEQKGLIAPSKEGTYRKYSVEDLFLLSRMRFYRSAGFSLDEAYDLLDEDLDGIAARMEKHVVDARRSLQIEQARLDVVEDRARLSREFEAESARAMRDVELEAFFFKPTYEMVAPDDHIVSTGTLKDWVRDFPFVQYASIARIGADGAASTVVGAMLPARFLPYVNDEVRGDIEGRRVDYYETMKVRYGLFEQVGGGSVDEYVEFGPCSLAIRRPITCRRVGDEIRTYWEVWVA